MLKKIFKALMPQTKPVIQPGSLYRIAKEREVNLEKEICIIGVRGFLNQGQNQRAIYDDAIFIVSKHVIKSFNANTDPGAFKKGIAKLMTGCWSYKIGIHGLSKPKALQYAALVQADKVSVYRDQTGKDVGFFGINIHRGGWTKVSSLGCQTIYPGQWDEFFKTVHESMKSNNQKTIKYILKEMRDDLD